jgi:hypothetical protein
MPDHSPFGIAGLSTGAVSVPETASRRAGASSGQEQMLALGQAVVSQPRYILADGFLRACLLVARI